MIKKIKNMVVFAIAMLPMALGAQTQTENYVVSKTYKKASTTKVVGNHVDSVSTAIQYFDGLGRAKQSVLVKAGSGFGNNQVPYDWSIGTPTNSGFYNLNGSSSENQIISGTTPFGDTDLLWECVNDAASGPDGGWVTDYIIPDLTKAYRYSVWIKKTGNLTDGTTYHGTQYVNNLDGSFNTNPYFWAGDLPQLDTWYLVVGYIHPSDYTGESLGISGVYDTQGNKLINGSEFKWSTTNLSKRFRNFLYYATDTNTRQYFWSPLVQKIDGSETSLDDLITTSTVFNNQEIDAKDIVTHYEYDGFGRQKKQFLPYASQNVGGSFNSSADQLTQEYYLNKYVDDFIGVTDPTEANAFSETIFEDSVLGRAVEQTAPGVSWKQGDNMITGKEYSDGHTIKMDYDFNATDEVKYFPITISVSGNTYTPSLGNSSYYNANELTKTITKDENWISSDGLNHTTEEFKDKSGQVVLKRTYNNSLAHDTYYIYDNYGNLTYVLPPKASAATLGITSTILDELCYQYKYDHRSRLVEKKIPGKGWEYIVYDNLDRPVLTQDALQRASNRWLFTKYDALGRVAYTGEYVNGETRLTMQDLLDVRTASEMIESRSIATLGTVGNPYYNNSAFPTDLSTMEVFIINYYNSYIDLPTGFIVPTENIYNVAFTSNTKGLPTINKTRVLTTNHWITTVTYYDHKARPIYIYSQNDYLGTTDIIESKLDDFTGRVEETTTTHKKTGVTDDIVTIDRFEYDHQDRLVNQTQKVNDQFSERIVKNNYDDLGQLKSKLTGNGTQKGYTDVTAGITITDDVITKTGGNDWNAGLATLGNFNADGYVEFTAGQHNKYFMVGLSSDNSSTHFSTIDYAIYCRTNQTIAIYESGTNKFISPKIYNSGDVFRVERISDKIYYKHNNEVIYISTVTSNGALIGDVSIYHTNGQIKNFHIVDNNKGLQNVDYTYNVRGWLKNINQDTQNDNDLFNFSLRYNDPTSGTALFNGNISQTSWNTLNTDSSVKTYTYSYDALNRITSGIDNTGNYNLTSVGYDTNGNILNLQRQGHTNISATTFGVMDNLSYTYDSGNKLVKVDEAAETTTGFKDVSGIDFTYDVNGNMITDGNKGITSIAYNHLNLPTSVSFAGQQAAISYVYDATGTKLKKTVAGSGISTTTTEYAGNHIYENGGLQFYNHAEGYTKAVIANGSAAISSFEYIYQYKDHLGNVRLSYSDTNNNGEIEILANTGGNYSEIIEESNYYPFGLKHKGYNNATSPNGNSVAQRFGFTGKEHQDELGLGWIDITARNYDAALGRWMNLDPLAEQMRRHSPYNYAFNNPIFFVDPDGMMPCPNGCGDEEEKISEADQDAAHEEKMRLHNEVKAAERKFIDWLQSDDPDDQFAVKMYNFRRNAQAVFDKPFKPNFKGFKGKLYRLWTGGNIDGVHYDFDGNPTGRAPVMGIVPVTPLSKVQTVGRWMSKTEYEIMIKTGRMVEGAGGQTFVTTAGAGSFKAAKVGSIYVEFQVPVSSLIKGGKAGWFKVLGPKASNAMKQMLNKQGGEILPSIKNISDILKVK